MPEETSGENRPTLLTPEEVATLLGLQPETLANWRWRGTGPPYANLGGRRVRYRLEDVERWIAEQVRSGGSAQETEGA